MKLCDKIIYLRKQQGWSQEELAEHLGVSRQSVSKWESGASTPELDRVVQLCTLFGLTADALIRDDLDSLPVYLQYKVHADNDSMYNTPNCWAIYCCGKVFKYLKNLFKFPLALSA